MVYKQILQLQQALQKSREKVGNLERSLTYEKTNKPIATSSLSEEHRQRHVEQARRYAAGMRRSKHKRAAELIEWFVERWNSLLSQPQADDRINRRAALLSQLVGAMGENIDPADFVTWQAEFFTQPWIGEVTFDIDGDGLPAARSSANPRDGFTEASVCHIAMALNQTVTNAQVLVMPTMHCNRPEARMSLFLSGKTINAGLNEFVNGLRRKGYVVVDKTRKGNRQILFGPR